ncbi:FKBP-type peptidyl-prolyl cis-trans isomerase [Natrialbaceae archaeon A-arb3/5]
MVEPGHVAVIHFTGRIAEGDAAGEIFDTTNVDVALEEGVYHDHRNYMPLEVRVGEGKIIDGCDRALQEMDVGERRTIELDPEDAFGARDETKVVEIPLEKLTPADDAIALEEGNFVRSESGETGWILEIETDHATIDFNHELAGLRLECELHVLEVHGTPDGQQQTKSKAE